MGSREKRASSTELVKQSTVSEILDAPEESVAPPSDAALDRILSSVQQSKGGKRSVTTERTTATPVAPVTPAKSVRIPTPGIMAGEQQLTWTLLRSGESLKALRRAQSEALALSSRLPASFSESKFALLNYAN
jgi:hypothetical protein